ncbi:MAG: hypothetical protein Hens2KO_25650 [Henriciella sp.]
MWQRSVPEAVQTWLDQLPDTHLPTGRFSLSPADAGACVRHLFVETGIADHPALAWLCQDADRLAALIARVCDVSTVRLRFEAVYDNACRKFHVDNVGARLICTYRGPGTQIGLGEHDTSKITTISTGAPILLKGRQSSQGQDIILQHRSPPIEGTGVSRLVLVLEPGHEDDEIGTSYDRRFSPN